MDRKAIPFFGTFAFLLFAIVVVGVSACSAPQLAANGDVTATTLETAYRHLEQQASALSLKSPRSELALRKQHTDQLGQHHLRFQQQLDGVPVWGRELIVHLGADGKATGITGKAQPSLQHISTIPMLAAPEVARRAQQALSGDGWDAGQQQLVVLPVGPRGGRLAWRVTAKRGLIRQFVFIDAMDGALLKYLEGSPS